MARSIFRRNIETAYTVISSPDNHFTAGPYCRVIESAEGALASAGGCPTIHAGIISPAGVQWRRITLPAQTIISLPVHIAV